jgi:hypothetical protein
VKRLFRKVNDKSSTYDPNHAGNVRRAGSYIYEEFLATGGTDVKVGHRGVCMWGCMWRGGVLLGAWGLGRVCACGVGGGREGGGLVPFNLHGVFGGWVGGWVGSGEGDHCSEMCGDRNALPPHDLHISLPMHLAWVLQLHTCRMSTSAFLHLPVGRPHALPWPPPPPRRPRPPRRTRWAPATPMRRRARVPWWTARCCARQTARRWVVVGACAWWQ